MSLPRPADRAWWLEEALAHYPGEPCPPLSTDVTADVMILGGGYTGLWTAWFLKERDPGLDIVLLEQDICGGGPSGRNGGFVNGFWDELPLLAERYGDGPALELCRAADREIDAIGEWCEANSVDAWYVKAGNVGVSTAAAFDGAWRTTADAARRVGAEDVYVDLSPEQVAARCRSPVFRGGVFLPGAALVQPARLAWGLRRALFDRGVRIFEGTPVTRFRAGPPVLAETPGGSVRAGGAVLGVNAWAIDWRAFRRSILARGTYIVLTAPAPEKLEEVGWTGGEGLYDFRTSLHYVRPTPDGRIAFGGAGMRATSTRRIGPEYRYEERAVARLVEDLYRWFPSFRDVPLDSAWGGPVDVSARRVPFFGTMPGGAVHYALGFTGNGVGPCRLAGRILSGLALGVEDAHTSLPIVGDRPKPFPPPPLLSLGARITSAAMIMRDDILEERRGVGPVTSFLAHLPRRLGYNIGP